MDNTEQHRRECEARYWLDYCDHLPGLIRGQLKIIEKKRGRAAMEYLRDEMRKQYKNGGI